MSSLSRLCIGLGTLGAVELVLSHGTVVLGGIMTTYRLSTVSGMSETPVLMNGKREVLLTRPLYYVGVHIGANSKSTGNRCGSFEWNGIVGLFPHSREWR